MIYFSPSYQEMVFYPGFNLLLLPADINGRDDGSLCRGVHPGKS